MTLWIFLDSSAFLKPVYCTSLRCTAHSDILHFSTKTISPSAVSSYNSVLGTLHFQCTVVGTPSLLSEAQSKWSTLADNCLIVIFLKGAISHPSSHGHFSTTPPASSSFQTSRKHCLLIILLITYCTYINKSSSLFLSKFQLSLVKHPYLVIIMLTFVQSVF